MRIRNFIAVLLITACPAFLYADARQLGLKLSEAENNAVNTSAGLKAVLQEKDAAQKSADAQFSLLYPKLSLEGMYRYNTSVSEISLPAAGSPVVKLGDNVNYSVGPSVSWMLWDNKGIRNSYASLLARAKAKEFEADAYRRRLLLSCRNIYFNIALAGEQTVLFSDALKLANKQYEDIKLNAKAGTKSRMDELLAHQEVILRQKQLSQARADMAEALRDLNALTGDFAGADVSLPLDARAAEDMPNDIPKPSALINVEPMEELLKQFDAFRNAKLEESHPTLMIYEELAGAAGASGKSMASELWPKLLFYGKSSLDYPNGPKTEEYNQNSLSVSMNWALFDWNAARKRVKESQSRKQSSLESKKQAASELERDLNKASDRIKNLLEQKRLNTQASEECAELAKITYDAYKAGSLTYLDVQNANFKLLEAKIQLAKTNVGLLINLAILASYAK